MNHCGLDFISTLLLSYFTIVEGGLWETHITSLVTETSQGVNATRFNIIYFEHYNNSGSKVMLYSFVNLTIFSAAIIHNQLKKIK